MWKCRECGSEIIGIIKINAKKEAVMNKFCEPINITEIKEVYDGEDYKISKIYCKNKKCINHEETTINAINEVAVFKK